MHLGKLSYMSEKETYIDFSSIYEHSEWYTGIKNVNMNDGSFNWASEMHFLVTFIANFKRKMSCSFNRTIYIGKERMIKNCLKTYLQLLGFVMEK